jgi:DNA-directed RNA polymerase subunit RPC12/RpoP
MLTITCPNCGEAITVYIDDFEFSPTNLHEEEVEAPVDCPDCASQLRCLIKLVPFAGRQNRYVQ